MAYEAVIGLECHIQLATRTKMFCECPAEFGAAPNSNVCPVCLGLPGALPITNRAAIDAALRLGLALGCQVRNESVFARKNYFYPDMPKNYQITQYDRPLCEGGALPLRWEGEEVAFPLIRIHAEEDTGKSFHPERYGDRPVSRVDFNRAGVPLLELVTQPAFRKPAECAAFLGALRRLVRWLAISDGDMEKGHLRCDANVSLRPVGQQAYGVKTEIKNLNSIKGVEKGLGAEIARQEGVLAAGGRIEQATLLYDADHDKLAIMRSKEYAHDYRYFPEPDLPLLRVDAAWVAEARARLPEPPWERERQFVKLGLPAYDAEVLSQDRDYSDKALAIVLKANNRKLASNFLMNEIPGTWRRTVAARPDGRKSLAESLQTEHLFEFVNVTAVNYPRPLANQVLEEMLIEGVSPQTIIARHGYQTASSQEQILPLVRAVIEEHPGPVAQYRNGKAATLGFLVGQVMKKSGGQAVPQTVRELLEQELAARPAGS
ncbi:MAG TPA: Asp-tRNA(Asn)/Glu-tRNA(Gln) amidotransferase subunit GatB [Candidatus Eisenbacteria bacterium]|jgi:aspartyl-tRNA(Asn)/glutamyl-tRNA(Gln) amidotransferase subunit B